MFPLHQQNIWESKHKAGEAEWESQPEGLARGRAQVEGRGCSEHGAMCPPCSLGAGCTGELCWLLREHLCRMEPSHVTALEERQGNLLSTENALQWKQGQEQNCMQWRKNLVIPGAQQAHTAHPKVKGGSFCHAWGSGRVRHGAAPAPAPSLMCTVQLLDTEMCCTLLGSFVTHSWCDGWCSGQAARTSWTGSGCVLTLCCGSQEET